MRGTQVHLVACILDLAEPIVLHTLVGSGGGGGGAHPIHGHMRTSEAGTSTNVETGMTSPGKLCNPSRHVVMLNGVHDADRNMQTATDLGL